MKTKKQKNINISLTAVVLCLLMLLLGAFLLDTKNAQAASGINQRLNFQGRLYNAAGAVIPDGDYNMEFKIVQDGDGCNPTSGTFPCGGTTQWTETRTGASKVTLRNGYFSVELGSITALPTTIWNQDTLWLSVNIGGTGAPAWDGEMKPLKRLTSSPYALNSQQLGGLSSSNFVQLAQGVQVDASNVNPSIFVNKNNGAGTPNILQLQKAGLDVFTVNNSGLVTAGEGLTISTGKNFTVNGDVFTDLTGNGLTVSSNTLTLNLAASADGLSTNTSSGSGLEVLASGLTLLQGCNNNQLLVWNETTDVWACNSAVLSLAAIGSLPNASGATISGSVLNLEPASASFGGVVTTGVQEFAGVKTFSSAIAANGGITFDNATDTLGAFTAAGTINMNSNILTNIGNTGTNFVATTGALNLAGLLTANGGITIGANTLTGTTGNIDYTNFDVIGSNGNTDIGGTITAGSGNVAVTNATGNVLHDALEDCADGQILKWTTAGRWECAADNSLIMSTRSFIDSTTNAVVDANTTAYWDTAVENNSSFPNLTPSSTSKSIYGIVTMEITGNNAADSEVVARSERSTGASVANCSFGTQVGSKLGGFTTSSGTISTITSTFIDSPATTGTVWFNICSDTATSGTGASITRIRVTLFEVDNSNADLAELYSTNDATIQAGEVVALDPAVTNGVKRTTRAYEKGTIGIISTAPALLIGGQDAGVTAVPVALAGRVPVKVSGENGSIMPGDLLTPASIPGHAMKATKAGPIIGQAMTAFEGGGQGTVMVFVKTSYSNGGGIAELLPDYEGGEDGGKLALAALVEGQNKISPVDLSEITTDRLMAGLEIISPRLIADEGLINVLSASSANHIQINDDVVIAGKLTVDKVKANQIEGLEIFTNKISQLENKLSTNQNGGATTGDDKNPDAGSTANNGSLQLDAFKNVNISLDLTVGGLLRANNGLTVGGQANFQGETFFHRLVSFVDRVIFEKEVTFKDTVSFNNDAGGFAVIHATQKEVKVKFSKPYKNIPLVTVNVRDGQFMNYAYKDLSKEGFTIVLKEPATGEVQFVWTALNIENALTQHGAIEPVLQ